MLEDVADFRFQVETFDWEEVFCLKANISDLNCEKETMPSHNFTSRRESFPRYHTQVSWSELEGINKQLAFQVWKMAERYGYGREPFI
mmetsp:Transcript_19831/g.24996  ORF Transcript_19831/g.24996 Transcript_19831/m.24996 type:complete len:88 (-) Transcript_19831:258-521(-)